MLKENATRHYVGEAGLQYHNTKRAIPENAVEWVCRLRAQKFAPYVGSGDTVLEFGVGSGWNLAQLSCKKRLGFDVSVFLRGQVEKLGIQFVPELSQIPTGSIDVVLCHHTLEHLKNPSEALEKMHSLLRPGGNLLLFVPYEKESRYKHFDSKEPNHHLFSWNVQTLGNLVHESGFHFVQGKIARFGYDRFAAIWANRLKLGEFGFRSIRAAVHAVKPAHEVCVVAVKN